jgi:hypothetical protein
MNISVLPCAPRAGGLRWILHVDKYDTRPAGVVAGHGTDRVDHVGGFVGNDIVSTANGKSTEMASKILLIAEDNGLLGLHVEELDIWSARIVEFC